MSINLKHVFSSLPFSQGHVCVICGHSSIYANAFNISCSSIDSIINKLRYCIDKRIKLEAELKTVSKLELDIVKCLLKRRKE